MSDNQSQKSSATNKTSRNKTKICGYDGKEESNKWTRHYDNHHPRMERVEWVPGKPLLDKPWCINWKEIIADKKIEPIDRLP